MMQNWTSDHSGPMRPFVQKGEMSTLNIVTYATPSSTLRSSGASLLTSDKSTVKLPRLLEVTRLHILIWKKSGSVECDRRIQNSISLRSTLIQKIPSTFISTLKRCIQVKMIKQPA